MLRTPDTSMGGGGGEERERQKQRQGVAKSTAILSSDRPSSSAQPPGSFSSIPSAGGRATLPPPSGQGFLAKMPARDPPRRPASSQAQTHIHKHTDPLTLTHPLTHTHTQPHSNPASQTQPVRVQKTAAAAPSSSRPTNPYQGSTPAFASAPPLASGPPRVSGRGGVHETTSSASSRSSSQINERLGPTRPGSAAGTENSKRAYKYSPLTSKEHGATENSRGESNTQNGEERQAGGGMKGVKRGSVEGFLGLSGAANGKEFSLVVQTYFLMIGRENPITSPNVGGNDSPSNGAGGTSGMMTNGMMTNPASEFFTKKTHCLELHRDAMIAISVHRPFGLPPFSRLPRHDLDFTRVGLLGIKKLSRVHFCLVASQAEPPQWDLTCVGPNGMIVDALRLSEMQTVALNDGNVSEEILNGDQRPERRACPTLVLAGGALVINLHFP